MKILMLKFTIVFFIFISPLMAQEDIQIGSEKFFQRPYGGYFDYSDPAGINIKVQVWGYVKFPGYYVIPARSTINELLSLAGGPTEGALLDDIRLLRNSADSNAIMYKYNYEDLLWNDQINHRITFPRMYAGDMLLIPGKPIYYSKDMVSLYLTVTSTLASITILIISLLK